MWGSWIAMMSQLVSMGPLRRDSWAVNEVLRFCCQILSLLGSVLVSLGIRGFRVLGAALVDGCWRCGVRGWRSRGG